MSRRQSFVVILIGLIAAAIAAAAIGLHKRQPQVSNAATLAASVETSETPSAVLSTPSATSAAPYSWAALSAKQRAALAPLERDWETFSVVRKRKWLRIAARYPSMSAEKQKRLHQRMTKWIDMTPKEREVARANFKHYNALSQQRRNKAWKEYQRLSEAQKKKLAAQTEHPLPSASSAPVNNGKTRHSPMPPVSPTNMLPDERSQH